MSRNKTGPEAEDIGSDSPNPPPPNQENPISPVGSVEGVSSSSEDEVVEKAGKSGASSDQEEMLPIPPPVPKAGMSILSHKLWIGNLDKRLTEQNILRFTMKYGKIVSFRYLFKTGPERPEQRDYVFVEYSTREEAERAKAALDGKKALGKRIIVDWARQDQGAAKKNHYAVSETWDASSVSETLDKTASTSAKIAALEAKLKQMEEGGLSRPPPHKKRRIGTTATSTTLRHMHATRQKHTSSKRSLLPSPAGQNSRRTFPVRH